MLSSGLKLAMITLWCIMDKRLEEIAKLHDRIARRLNSPCASLDINRSFCLEGWLKALAWVLGEGQLPIEFRKKEECKSCH